jgi:hypothetical protein
MMGTVTIDGRQSRISRNKSCAAERVDMRVMLRPATEGTYEYAHLLVKKAVRHLAVPIRRRS